MVLEQPRVYGTSMRVDPYCSTTPRFLGVVDANALLSSVRDDCRKGEHCRSRLLRMTGGLTVALYASDHVYWEVYEHLDRIARWSKVPIEVLRARFEKQYLPAMRFVMVDVQDIVDPQVLAINDPDDVPSGQLTKLLGPCIVFSEDRDLRRPGLAPEDWRQVAHFAVDGVTGQRTTGSVIALPLQSGVELAKFVGRRTGLSPWLIGGLVAGGA